MCAHLGPGLHGKLRCDRTTPHDEDAPGGHTYPGSSVDDLHTVSENAAEVSRG